MTPTDISKGYVIYRDNDVWGTYYFIPQIVNVNKFHKFKCNEAVENFDITIAYAVIDSKGKECEFTTLYNQITTNKIRYQKITIDDISEPYRYALSSTLLSLNSSDNKQ